MDTYTAIPAKSWRYFYIAWFIYAVIIASVDTTNIIMERIRAGSPANAWHPIVTEFTGVLSLFVLIPLIKWFDGYFIFQRDAWKTPLVAHLLFTFPFAVVHSILFIVLRKLIYPLFGASYEFGHLAFELLYEYRKITIGYSTVVLTLYAFRHYVLLRYLLSLPDAHSETDAGPLTTTYLHRILAQRNDREVIIDTQHINFLEAAGNYVVVHTSEGQLKLRTSLSGIENQLNPKDFVRVHRSHIVNIEAIKEIQPWFRGDQRIILKNGDMINLSRRYRENFTSQATAGVAS